MVFAQHTTPAQLKARGREVREKVPFANLADYVPRGGERGVELVLAANEGRLDSLIPLRMTRMADGPFAFMRGASAVMAHDLARSPATKGLDAQICGDAHLSNFGTFASPERRQVMDLNDFDETVLGPFEYDLKRLVASVVVVARESAMPTHAADDAVRDAVLAYRRVTRALARMAVREQWAVGFDRRTLRKLRVSHLEEVLSRVVAKAGSNDSSKVATKMTVRSGDRWAFREDPPILRRLKGAERDAVRVGLSAYAASIQPARFGLLTRYGLEDLAFRVAGVGSVGTRAYLALLRDSNDDPFVLQIKQARPSVLAGDPRCVVTVEGGDARRVVTGQRIMQTVSDPMLGWTEVEARPALVRTFRDLKGSIDPLTLAPNQLDDYARVCGALLARAHARSLDPHVLWGYVGKGEALAESMIGYAHAYADQTETDFAAFTAGIASGRIPVATG